MFRNDQDWSGMTRSELVKKKSRNITGRMKRVQVAFSKSGETEVGQDGEIFPLLPS